jgi:hypothetical protein
MAWNYYQKERGGRFYWYAQKSVRLPGRRTPVTHTRYIGPSFLKKGTAWEKSDITKSLRAAKAHFQRAHPPSPAQVQKQNEMHEFQRDWDKVAEAQKVRHALEERENARQPATEAARDRYMDLRARVEADVHKEASHAPALNSVDEEIEAREGRFEAVVEEYNEASGSEPVTEPSGASPVEPSHPSLPDQSAGPSSFDGPR